MRLRIEKGKCWRCGGFVCEERDENLAAKTHMDIMGRSLYCINCGCRIFEKILGIKPPKYAFHRPYHRSMGI